MKLAIVLFNLGGPDSPEAVEPFLHNLFSDPAIIRAPGLVRKFLAKYISSKRAPIAREIYAKIGGRSPIVEETDQQAYALDAELASRGFNAKSFIAMRYWKPFTEDAARAVKEWGADQIVLLPLYPQFSTTTSESSLKEWRRAAEAIGLKTPTARVCCYPYEPGFIQSAADSIRAELNNLRYGLSYRLLLTAHGLPERIVKAGDPYAWQVNETARAIVEKLGVIDLDWTVCYQSRVGRLKWIDPATDAEIHRAARDKKGVIMAPIAFVSEHSETLVELDIEYRKLAGELGVPDYRRVPTVSVAGEFIMGLADLVVRAINDDRPITCGAGRICPRSYAACGYTQ